MDNLRNFLIIFICLMAEVSSRALDRCYADYKNPYVYAGTKTPYHFVHGKGIGSVNVPNCKPVQVWLLQRHGTRYPAKSVIPKMLKLTELRDEVVENHEVKEQGSLCNEDLNNLKQWELDPNVNMENVRYLTPQGEEDLYEIGQRLRNNLPQLFSHSSNDTLKDYKFRSTDTQRTRASMEAFIKGFFDKDVPVNKEVVPAPEDHLLLMYKICDAWLEETKKPYVNVELDAFINGPEFQKLVENVSKRLGFPNSIATATIFDIFDGCRFDKAWNPTKLSPWCAAFTKEDMKVLEYEDDIFNYYRVGYGGKLSRSLGCSPVQDLYNSFLKLENGDSEEPKGVFYFSHSATLQSFYTAMGIAEDKERLTASNYKNAEDRKWRTSVIVPFTVNFGAVFYKCKSNEDDVSNKVMLYLAEKPLSYEGCDNGLCDWEYLKKKLEPVASSCNFEYCKNRT